MIPSIDVLLAGPADREAVAALYAEAGYGAAVAEGDTVIVAKAGTLLVGVVRLCREEAAIVLRGMQVREAYRGQGIGTRLLAACVPHMDRSASEGSDGFCLPYTHLEPFYAAAGFARAHDGELPGFLARRLAAYRAGGQDVLAMRRRAPAQPR